MSKATALLIGAGIGTAVMYFFDPDRGSRRRALLRDQAVHARKKLQRSGEKTAAAAGNRAQGYKATLRSQLSKDQPSDDALMERARAVIGRVVSHPGAIEVTTNNGVVTLAGPVLAEEVPLLIDRVLDLQGVRDIVNRLQVHEAPGNVPALQGGGKPRGGDRSAFFQRNWSPAARLGAGAAGAAAFGLGVGRRGIAGKALGLAGLALLARAATNLELRQFTRMGSRRYPINVEKTIRVNAPVERVFELWADCENFPQFATHVREVRRIGDTNGSGRWHWKVRGTSGLEFEFDSAITAYEENRFIAWRSEPGAWVQHAGSVRFLGNPDGSTTADIKMSYHPVAGAAGHVIAKLLGDDPKRQLDDDLLRMKSFVETGIRPRDAASPRPAL